MKKIIIKTTLITWIVLTILFMLNALLKFPSIVIEYSNYDYETEITYNIEAGIFGPKFIYEEFRGHLYPSEAKEYVLDGYKITDQHQVFENDDKLSYSFIRTRLIGIYLPIILAEFIILPIISCIITLGIKIIKSPKKKKISIKQIIITTLVSGLILSCLCIINLKTGFPKFELEWRAGINERFGDSYYDFAHIGLFGAEFYRKAGLDDVIDCFGTRDTYVDIILPGDDAESDSFTIDLFEIFLKFGIEGSICWPLFISELMLFALLGNMLVIIMKNKQVLVISVDAVPRAKLKGSSNDVNESDIEIIDTTEESKKENWLLKIILNKRFIIVSIISWSVLAGLYVINSKFAIPGFTIGDSRIGLFGTYFIDRSGMTCSLDDVIQVGNTVYSYRGPCWVMLLLDIVLFPIIGNLFFLLEWEITDSPVKMVVCPNCQSTDIYTVLCECPDMTEEEGIRHEQWMKDNKIVYGPDDKQYYCKNCDKFF